MQAAVAEADDERATAREFFIYFLHADKWLRKTRDICVYTCKYKRENDFIGRAGCYAAVRKTTRLIGCTYNTYLCI